MENIQKENLIGKIFFGHVGSDKRWKLLQKEMNILYKQLEKIHNMPNSKVLIRIVSSLLRRESAFAAFKGRYVRKHIKEYPALQKYVE